MSMILRDHKAFLKDCVSGNYLLDFVKEMVLRWAWVVAVIWQCHQALQRDGAGPSAFPLAVVAQFSCCPGILVGKVLRDTCPKGGRREESLAEQPMASGSAWPIDGEDRYGAKFL